MVATTGKKGKIRPWKIFVIIALTLIGVFALMPFIWMILSSFKTDIEITRKELTFLPKNPTFVHYEDLFTRVNFGQYLKNNIILVLFSFLGLLINAMAGYGFAKFDFKGKNVLFMLVLATIMIPSQVTLIPLYMMAHTLHLTNTLFGIALPSLAGAYAIFLFRQFIGTISDSLIEAAKLDGAGEIYVFLRIILPLSKPILAVQSIFTFVGAWNAFLWPLIAANNDKYYTLSVGLGLLSTQYAQKYGLMMAGATIMIVPIIIVYIIFQKSIIKGINVSGMK